MRSIYPRWEMSSQRRWKGRPAEWKLRNPGQIATAGATMMLQVGSPYMSSFTHQDNRTSYPDTRPGSLCATDRIAALEQEIYNLRGRQRFDGVLMPPRRPAPQPDIAPPVATTSAPSAPSPPVVTVTQPPVAPVAPSPPDTQTSQPAQPQTQPPIHPFAKAKEPNYLPPHERVFAAPPKPSKERERDYQIQAPIESPKPMVTRPKRYCFT